MDITSGPLLKKAIIYTIPVMASDVLQLLFNACDMAVLGNFSGNRDSFASVGSINPVVQLFTLFLVGFGVGVNVLIARYVGENEKPERISKLLHTAILTAIIAGIIMSLLGLVFSDALADVIMVPQELRSEALTYMRICVLGSPFIALFNFGAASLRAIGDTRHPLIFLVTAGILNVILNLIFVLGFEMGTMGVALATVISQGVNAFLTLFVISRMKGYVQFSPRKLAIDFNSLRALLRYGLPASIQSTLFSLSNVAITGAINSYGALIVAGSTAGYNCEMFLFAILNSLQVTTLTFVSQNFGAKKPDRIKKVVRINLSIIIVLGLICSLLSGLIPHVFLAIFNPDPAVIAQGRIRLIIMGVTYFIYGIDNSLLAAIRSCGYPVFPVVIQILFIFGFRTIFIAFLDTPGVPIYVVYLTWPISWILLLISFIIFWFYICKKKLPTLTV